MIEAKGNYKMTFDEYQEQALTTEMMERPEKISANDPAFVAKVLGLVGEAGELADKYKKLVRDKDGVILPEDRDGLAKELGDILWYLTVVADYLGLKVEDIAQGNLAKLASRKARGVQKGSGDDR
jgi:NTP pyrophosphatase (non-canonical NTP hydrolase)